MRSRREFLSMVLVLGAGGRGASGAAGKGTAFRGLDGRSHQPFTRREGKAVVVLFLGSVCPISNALAPEISRIFAEYCERGVAVYGTYPDPSLSAADARKHADSFGFRFPILLDPEQRLVRKAGATVTPEAAVFDVGGKLLYRGRINDLYADLGKRRPAATTHDLRAALDALLAGKPVAQPRTRAVGCFIPDR